MVKSKIKFIVERSEDLGKWELATGITQEVEASLFGDGWLVTGGGWSGYGESLKEAELDWLRSRLTKDCDESKST